jgi:uncharacterized protein
MRDTDYEAGLRLLKELGFPEDAFGHIRTVETVALRISDEVDIPIDRDLIRLGALLHDIGRMYTQGIGHALAGADMLRRRGIDERIALIVERHTGAGISKEEASSLGLPEKDYLPETPEEKIVAYSDSRTSGTREMTFLESLERFRKLLGEDHPAVGRYIKLHEEIEGWKKPE